MKCFVLAGGSGDALWPLSRKNYPKQFIYIREGRSLFQETIARNLPFCDDFYIITNKKYRYIVEGQMQAFQGLSYQCFLEEKGRQTAPAVAIAAMCVEPEETVLVVSTDHLIGEGDYNGTILAGKELLSDDNIVAVGCSVSGEESEEALKGHGAFICEGNIAKKFIARCQSPVEEKGELLLDSGIFMMKAGTYLKAIKENAPDLYEKCLYGTNRVRIAGKALLITKQWLQTIPALSVGEGVFEKWAGKHLYVVQGDFRWSRLLNLESFDGFEAPSLQGAAVTNECRNVSVFNEDASGLVVVNGCEDLVVVSTKDAAYISRKGESHNIRKIINDHYEEQKEIFDEGDIYYTSWGIKEMLNRSKGYMVRKVTIFPGCALSMHKHEKRNEHWSVVSGTATITMNGETKEYGSNDSIFVPMGTFHKISNQTAKDLVVIEVCVGTSAGYKVGDMVRAIDDFVKLGPAYKDYLWGGKRLYENYGKVNRDNKEHIIAESWEVSAHSAGPSRIVDGNDKGRLFPDYLEKIGKDALGWKCQPFDRFPLLIKLIDAKQALSVQVHPDDEYAMSVEGEYGKNEMWYVMDAAPDAGLYVGFSKELTKEECKKHIEEGTLTEVLKRIPVKKGDVIFVKAGTVHAILEGLLILEIQQSSNATYRLYDYDRVDKNGNKRQLHLEKALDNLDYHTYEYSLEPEGEKEQGKGYTKQLLGECKYFSATLYEVEDEAELSLDDASFSVIVFLEGTGTMETENRQSPFRPGDSFFVPAGKKVLKIKGKGKFVLSRI